MNRHPLVALILAAAPAFAGHVEVPVGELRPGGNRATQVPTLTLPSAPISAHASPTLAPALATPALAPSVVPAAAATPALAGAAAARATPATASPAHSAAAPATEASVTDRPALAELKSQLRALQEEERSARARAEASDATGHDYRGGAAEARARELERAGDLRARIQEKNREIESARTAERARYDALKNRLSALKKERAAALLDASASGSVGHDYRGGAAEARGRAHERAAEAKARIAETQREISAIERQNPSFAGFRAPLVLIAGALGRKPVSPARKALLEEIGALEKERDAARAIARESARVAHDYRGGGDEARARSLEKAGDFDARIVALRKRLEETP